jgi:hypothetical protein
MENYNLSLLLAGAMTKGTKTLPARLSTANIRIYFLQLWFKYYPDMQVIAMLG